MKTTQVIDTSRVSDAVEQFVDWTFALNVGMLVVVVACVVYIVRQVVKMYPKTKAAIEFIYVLQELPGFMQRTEKQIHAICKHLEIDPRELEEERHRGA